MTGASRVAETMMRGEAPLLSLELKYEHDVVLARQRARQLGELLGFDRLEQTWFATSVSELARNAFEYAGGGIIRFGVRERAGTAEQLLVATVKDSGPGIACLSDVLDGRYVSTTGMGLGILGARRLNDHFHIDSAAGRGTTVEIGRRLPSSKVFRASDSGRIASALAAAASSGAYEDVQRQNQELLAAMEEVRAKQAQVERLNTELAETNRGVLALYAELDDRASDLKRASEYKSRFLSDVSHELRTPLTSVLNLSRILLDHTDGDLTSEQDRQVRLIKNAVESVIDLVNELLDLARIEAGKTTLVLTDFAIGDFFSALRAICRPLVSSDAVTLSFDDFTGGDTVVHTDEKRLAQILRNFVSNAIKFTELGEIRVVASRQDETLIRFDVIDTGIGIAPADQARIFDDFVQVDGPIQRRVRGTGLGLPLTRKLAVLLGGTVEVSSEVGTGSTFSVVVPCIHPEVQH